MPVDGCLNALFSYDNSLLITWERIQIFHTKTQLLQRLLLQNQTLPCPEPPSFVLPWLSSSEF